MTSTEPTDAHRAAPEERSQVVTTLAKAFFDDQTFRWLVPDDAHRRRCAPAMYSLFVDACWPHRQVYAAGGGYGAALWFPPGTQLVDADHAEAFGRAMAESVGDDEAIARMLLLTGMFDEHHPHDPHWYLAFMGVDPVAQGQGIGGRLLAAVLAQADREGMPAYLEASSQDNRRLYERHGFETTQELSVADSPTIYAMWRPAAQINPR